VNTFTYQPALRPALPLVYGPVDYREHRALFEQIDGILTASGIEQEFIDIALAERQIDAAAFSAKSLERFAIKSVLALRCNIARMLTGLDHREFCVRLADSALLQWFLRVGTVDCVKVFAKSSSDRFSKLISAAGIQTINDKLTALLAQVRSGEDPKPSPAERFGLPGPVSYDDIYFDSTCLKCDIHFPVDWVLLRDAARTLMKATVLIRKHGLKNRMPQEPLGFLSEMNTLCMKMTAAYRDSGGGKKPRKKVLREMKTLEKRIAAHATAHLEALRERRDQTDLSEAQARQITDRMDKVLKQLPAAIKQAHERIIGGRQVANQDKILSFYDDSVNVIKRGKAGAAVEFGNKLWLGENQNGIIVSYELYQDNPSDSKLVKPAIEHLVDEIGLDVKRVWGDRGLASKPNSAMLENRGIVDGLCPRNVYVLTERLDGEEGFREGLKRRAGTEARIGIFKNVFAGRPMLRKGFESREIEVGWAVLAHNLWVVGRMAREETKRREQLAEQDRPKARAA
jgi:hypothetical protein